MNTKDFKLFYVLDENIGNIFFLFFKTDAKKQLFHRKESRK